MFVPELLLWWYGRGWRHRIAMLRERIAGTMDYFSIDLLLKTLFQPFRQISAGRVQGPLGVQMRAFFDRLVSRVIGAMVRFTMIIIGSAAIIFQVIFGVLLVIAWGFVPLIPFVGIVLFVMGWTLPWSL